MIIENSQNQIDIISHTKGCHAYKLQKEEKHKHRLIARHKLKLCQLPLLTMPSGAYSFSISLSLSLWYKLYLHLCRSLSSLPAPGTRLRRRRDSLSYVAAHTIAKTPFSSIHVYALLLSLSLSLPHSV